LKENKGESKGYKKGTTVATSQRVIIPFQEA
jgi:hypothetical protein